MTTVYLVFFNVGPWSGADEFCRIFGAKDAAQAWIDGRQLPEYSYIREEELE